MTTFELVLIGLLVKHFVVDFLIQTPYQYLNKGTYGHPGGLLHAWLHWAGTLGVLLVAGVGMFSFALAFLDFIAHYHIDWAKVKITKSYGLTPTNSEKYWWLLGLDQLLHQLTYVAIGVLAL